MSTPNVTYNSVSNGTAPMLMALPPGTEVGDALLLFVNVNGVLSLVTPDGFELLGPRLDTAGMSAAGYWKVADQTDIDAGSISVPSPGGTGTKMGGVLAAYPGMDAAFPVHAYAALAATAAGTVHGMPSVATTLANCQIVTAYVDKNTGETTITPPSGYTMRGTPVFPGNSGQCVAGIADDPLLKPPGSYGAGSWTGNVSTSNAVVFTVALAPLTTSATVVPVADVTTAGWTGTPSPGAGVPLASLLADNDDGTYAESPANPSGSVFEFKFGGEPESPTLSAAPNTVTVRLWAAGGASTVSVKADLYDGSTQVTDHAPETVVVDVPTDYRYTLTAAEKALCTDLSDLRLRLTVSAS